jgi:hypothetical protein
LDVETATEIIDNDDNLKPLLLTALLRGRDDDIKRWISGQTKPKKDVLNAPRVDIGSEALFKMCGLLDAIDSGKTTFEAESSLRRAHGNH